MAQTIKRICSTLESTFNRYEEEALQIKQAALYSITPQLKIPKGQLERLTYWVLFIAAHASSKVELRLAKKALMLLTKHFKQVTTQRPHSFINSGLPYTLVESNFSATCNQWLLRQKALDIQGMELTNEYRLNQLLKHTLPALEVIHTTAGYTNEQLFDALGIKPKQQLPFLVEQANTLQHKPFIADQLWEQLGVQTTIYLKQPTASILFNQKEFSSYFYHKQLEKKPNILSELTKAVTVKKLDSKERGEVAQSIQLSLLLMARETDPATYMDESSIRCFELGKGITVALFTMQPNRQLPLESYIGYTLFKNGYPAAYGGAWVFGKRALFGINISPWFRGGESANMIVQLLRVYHQYLGVQYIEVEPYQYGLDNPEGISTGAFWFYYRLGFRPIDDALNKLASAAFEKMRINPKYRSSIRTLTRFTEGNIALQLGNQETPLSVYEISLLVQKLINKTGNGNRSFAIEQLVKPWEKVLSETPIPLHQTIEDFILLRAVLPNTNLTQNEIIELATLKQKDWYAYQQLLLKVLSRVG